jgi:hypothetical protein
LNGVILRSNILILFCMQRYSGKLLAAMTAIVMIVGSFHPTVARAAAGEGTATIAVGTGTLTNASTATYGSDLSTVGVTVGTLAYLKVKITVGASHIAGAQNNVTVQIPTNLFPANGFDTNEEAAITDVNAVGEYFIAYTDTSGVTNNAAISFAASASANTGLITIQADQQMDATDIIVLTVAVNDLNNFKTATALTISIDDTGANSLVAIASQPTVSTAAADAAASVVLGTNNYVGATGSTTVTLTLPLVLDADDTIDITFPSSINVSGVASAVTGTFEASDSITCAAAGQVVTCTTSAATNATGTIIMTGIKAAFAATTDITSFEVENEGNATNDIAVDSVVAMSDTLSSDSEDEDSSGGSVARTYDIDVTVPAAADAYMPGEDMEITWTTMNGTGTPGFVSLYYSVDGGTTLETIALNTVNDSSYTWTVPALSEESVVIVAKATDLLTVLATGESGAFSIGADVAVDDEEVVEDTTTEEDVDLLADGSFMKGESWDTVYYVHNGMRHPFLDSQTFFTYADDFSDVIEVADEDLSNYTIGTPMLPKAGVVLVKVQSVNSVFALEADNTLRWITSEEVAEDIYGSDWADYVIDVPVTAWGHFNHGEDIENAADTDADETGMQTRDELNSK